MGVLKSNQVLLLLDVVECLTSSSFLLQVNDVNFENMSNDDAVRVLREAVHKPG